MAAKGDISKFDIQPALKPDWITIDFENALEKTSISHKLKSKDFFSEGNYPVIDQGSNLIAGYVDDSDLLYKGELPIVVFGDHTRNIKFIDFKFAVGADGTKILKPKKNINSKFFYYYLSCLKVPDFGYSRHYSIFKILDFPIPPLAEQERIVAKLDSLFAQHEVMKKALSRIPDLLKDFRQQVLTQAVTGKLTNTKNISNKIISDFFEVKTGATPKKGNSKYYEGGIIPWIKSGEVKNKLIFEAEDFITELAVKETNAKIFPIDTILVAMYGEGKTRGQVGWLKIEATTNQALAALVNEDLDIITKKYIYLFCLSQYVEIRAQAEGGNQPNLNLSKIKNWKISIPDVLSEQQEIVSRVESLFAKADVIEQRYKHLKEKINVLPKALLHKAFKGELVEQLPTDVDAKDLLKEILELKKEGKKK